MQSVKKHVQASTRFTFEREGTGKFGQEILENKTSGKVQNHTISIFSPDRFIQDFLHGILIFQGHKSVEVKEIQEIFWELSFDTEQLVFLDGAYLVGPEAKSIRYRIQQFAQAGVKILVLADRRQAIDLTGIHNTKRCQILWKPLDYRQVGQAIAQI